jgi:hypothetical protein
MVIAPPLLIDSEIVSLSYRKMEEGALMLTPNEYSDREKHYFPKIVWFIRSTTSRVCDFVPRASFGLLTFHEHSWAA